MKNVFNLRKTKYGLPLILLPFVVFLAYVISDIFPAENKKGIGETQKLEGFNTNLPDPSLSQQKDKFQLLLDLLQRRKDESGLQSIEELRSELEAEYELSNIEKFLHPITDTLLLNPDGNSEKSTEDALRALHQKYFPDEPDPFDFSPTIERQPKNQQELELIKMREQMARIDSMLLAKTTTEPINPENDVLVATKADGYKSSAFYTLTGNKKDMYITAILDEARTVVDGSRIRIRLLDDIFIGDYLYKKGSYLYGLVSGFRAQRVNVNITSVLCGDRILKTNLSIYDNDGIQGLYVPNSDFREMMRQAGSRMAQSSNVNINSSQTPYQQLISQMGQDFYRSVTQAVSVKIRQNKAKLKYASQIYLINENEQLEKY